MDTWNNKYIFVEYMHASYEFISKMKTTNSLNIMKTQING